ncbi:MAG TPA: diacylglycerol kinase family protein [Candidatus Angelobacter sp.]|nr:diacylglycerol kinase family protein [Candidatus Angelobacter sp.]
MKRALLIYNPSSGRRREHRVDQVSRALAIFRAAGVAAESCATTHTGSAVTQAQEAVAAGFDTVIACGGDGTANEILNGLMLSSAEAVLGVLPFGSGNVLATDLCLPIDAEAAAQALLRYKPRALQPGLMSYQDRSGLQKRYFVIVAGVGSDAELMYRTAVEAKERYGVYAYFLEMFRMALRRRFPMFKVEWKDEQGNWRSGQVAMVMAVRASRFPGLLKRARLGAELARNDYRLMLFHTNKVRHFLNYLGSVMSGRNWTVPQVELAHSTWFRCTPLASQDPTSIHAEVDGELLGTLPVEVTIEPRTFNLLMPQENSKEQS